MTERLAIVVLVALAAALVILLTKKWGISEWYQVHGDRFTSKLFSCDLCMSFWTAFLMGAALAAIYKEPQFYLVAFFSTPITRMIV